MRKTAGLISGIVILGAVLSVPWRMTTEYCRVQSSDGGFYAVARCPLWRSLVPLTPGQAGDKPGYIEVFTREGRSCGRAAVRMVSMINDLRWTPDAAEIPAVAAWDLQQRTARRLQ